MRETEKTRWEREDLAVGRNAVLELLRSGRPIDCIYLQKGLGGTASKIAAIAREQGIVLKEVAPQKLEGLCGSDSHQGVVAQVAAAPYSRMEDIFARAGDAPLFVVLCDGIEDPHNLGAILRTAEGAGAHGVIIPKRRSAGLTWAVGKTSAGALAHLPVVRVANLGAAIDGLKQQGVWFYAADMDGQTWCQVDYSGPVGLVVGAENRGVSRLIQDKCDFAVSLPMLGQVSSLNASVAAGIVLYEIARQRGGLGSPGKGAR